MSSNIINSRDTKRIQDDAYIAIDALQGIVYSGNNLHESYLKEKVDKAQRCLDFIKGFCGGDDDEQSDQ